MEQNKDCKSHSEFAPIFFNLQLKNKKNAESSSISEVGTSNTNISKRAPDIEHYCRVCGSEDTDQNLIPVFGKQGQDLSLGKKIFDFLHLQVKEDDKLPQKVCIRCISQLNAYEQFLKTSQNAASKLKQLFLPDKTNKQVQTEQGEKAILNDLQQDVLHSNNNGVLKNDDCRIIDNTCDKEIVKAKKQEAGEEKGQTPVLCHVCGKAFKDMKNLHSHKRTHLPEELKKKYQCSECEKSFRTNFHLSEHRNSHEGVTPYACSTCDKRFHTRALLRQHNQVHQVDDSKKVACPECGLKCSRKGSLRAHLRTHSKNRLFSCVVCHQQFPSFGLLLSHRKQHSQAELRLLLQHDLIKDKDRIITCHLCGKIFTDKRILATHLERLHGEGGGGGKAKHECNDCGKVLHSLRTLVYHRRSRHLGERTHRCAQCGEGFLQLKLLRAHETKHTGERPFLCDTCGKGFRSRNNLDQHSLKHNGERKFVCVVCGKTFLRKAALDVHSRRHRGEKPFVCDLCGQGFTLKSDLQRHQNRHQQGSFQDRTCEHCLRVFSSKKELLKHKEEAHRNECDVVPLIITNNMFETHVITEDGQKLVFPIIDSGGPSSAVILSVPNPDVQLVADC